ncbi:MAG: Gfo/Idh/MocA family oxidoreductase [Planctomycetes bacterium]|nr:Gfo/Idh/MocA family oxidoreductase [Planctomycetota bacterium]
MGRPLRVGMIGAGGISRAHLRAYQRFPGQAALVAVCDVREDAARQRAAEAGVSAVYTDAERMLREASIDAVDLCTVHDQHAPLGIAAAGCGKHVLVEKPMACSMKECLDMVDAAARAGVILMAAQCQRFQPDYRGVRHLLKNGEIGRIYAVQFDSMQNLPALLPQSHWLFDGQRAGGGIVISVSVHKIDLLRYFLGNVRSVFGVCRTLRPEFIHNAEDYACATLEFEAGIVGEHFATYSGFRMPWGEKFLIFGEMGAFHDTQVASRTRGLPGEGWAGQFGGYAPVEPIREGLPTDDGFVNEILHFADCCVTGREPLTSGRDNLETMKVIFGIYESSRTGRRVDLAAL